ncbi:HNH endonuclease [Sanguibacter sp. HDW7]|nr:HNH endonuclease [Sanguibacter sp. HDW7]
MGTAPRTLASELVGHGPIDDATALALVANASSLRRVLTDPVTGVALDMSRDTYAVPAPLRTFLQLRDETCQFPGCRRPAPRCDVDHVDDWAHGGTTSADNLVHLCRAHHRLKHGGDWQCTVLDPEVAGLPTTEGQRLRPMVVLWTDPHGGTRMTGTDLRPGGQVLGSLTADGSTPTSGTACDSPPSSSDTSSPEPQAAPPPPF